MSADRGSAGCTDRGDPARIARRRVLRLLLHRVGVARGHERQWTECVYLRERDFVSDAAKMRCDPIGYRCSNAGAHLDIVAVDGDPSVGREVDGRQSAVASTAVILGGTSDAGTDKNSRLLSAGLLLGALLPDRVSLQLV